MHIENRARKAAHPGNGNPAGWTRPSALTPGPSPSRTPAPPGEGSVVTLNVGAVHLRLNAGWKPALPAKGAAMEGRRAERPHAPLSRRSGCADGRGAGGGGGEGRRP